MSYPTEKLGKYIDILSGFAFKSKDFSNTGVPVIKIKNITPPYVSLEDVTYVPNDIATQQKKFQVHYGDILIALTGSHINQMASVVGRIAKVNFFDKALLNQRVGKIYIVDDTSCNLDYVYYFLSQEKVKIELASKAGGAANQANISPTDVKNLQIPFPSKAIQDRIADILLAYDNLIENNQKQIKLLEEAAQRIYKEWFVDLQFPGYETTPVVDGVPEGWAREYLVDVVNVQYGYAFDSSLFNSVGNGTPIARIRNILSGTTMDFTPENADTQYIIHNGDILVGMDGEFHINSWSGKDAYLVQRTCRFRPINPNMTGYILQAIYDPIKYFEKTVVGATVAHLGKKHIDTFTILTGPSELYVPFQQYFNRRQLLLNQNLLLSEARDRLLSKLMSGEIEVWYGN